MKLLFNIKRRLFVILIINSIVPLLIVTLISINNYSTLLDAQIASSSSSVFDNSRDRMEDMLTEIHRVSQTLVFQQTDSSGNNVLSILNKQSQGENFFDYTLLENSRRINFIMQSFLYSHNYINGMYIFTKNNMTFSYSKGYGLKYDYNPANDDWYRKTLEGKGKLVASEVSVHNFFMTAEPSILFSTLLYAPDTLQPQGVLLIDCNLSIFSTINKNIPVEQGTIFLVDDQGKYLYHPDKSKINTLLEDSLEKKISLQTKGTSIDPVKNTYVIFDTLGEQNWKIVASFSARELGHKFKQTLSFTIAVILVCIVLSFIISILFSNQFSKPIIKLSHLMKNWEDTHSLASNKQYDKRKDEIGILYRYFNAMIGRIDSLIRDKYQTQLITMDAEMKALEAQINSHFLYNTLESINSMAEIEGVEGISIMTKALGDMFRYSIKTDSELVCLEEELKHNNDYLVIQKIRYNDKISAQFHIQPGLLQCKILKLILQPIVENAITHGLEYKKHKGTITISAYSEDKNLILQIADDGMGMTAGQLKKLQDALNEQPQFERLGRRDKRGIGIVNVNTRIKLYYGKEYGLKVSSRENLGTCIQIVLPLINEPQEGNQC